MKTKLEKFSQSVTLKGLIILVLTLLMLIPGAMIRGLIRERQERSEETIGKINSKWSDAQTLCGPVITMPYAVYYTDDDNKSRVNHTSLTLTPEKLEVKAQLLPEVKYYGIYKTILYKSRIEMSGEFNKAQLKNLNSGVMSPEKAQLKFGLSDLKGVASQVEFVINGRTYDTEAAGSSDYRFGQALVAALGDQELTAGGDRLFFSCKLDLNGSSYLNFVPIGQTTRVDVSGAWASPSFIGGFSPESTVTESGFDAKWNVLRFNRNIPEVWVGDNVESFDTFGVSLIEPVDHYQQNMRSAKYASMFIILTFVVFFFVEILTHKRIHPIQYLLVGFALILFYSLLLSISEQIGFGWAYLIASAATIALITAYTSTIFRNKAQTGALAAILALLYVFLYVVLQLEDVALLIGSIGLFVILGIIMYFSRKVNWYKPAEGQEGQAGK